MTQKPLLAATALAGLLACTAAPRTERLAGEPPRRRTVATFSGAADPATGALRVVADATGVPSALTEVPVVQDGTPGSGPTDTVELVTEGTPGTVAGRCGVSPAFEGTVRVRSFYPAHTLSNLHVEITSISGTGHESCRSSQPVLGTSITHGLFAYPSLTTAGSARSSAAVGWSFAMPDQLPFTFQGRVLADVLSPCSGTQVLGTPVTTIGSASSSSREIATADFDGDGVLDVAILAGSATTSSVRVFLGLGNGRFAWAQDVTGGGSFAAADVTGDGLPELLVANGTDVNVYRNVGGGLVATAVTIATGGTVSNLAVGELTGDGRPDLVVIDYSGGAVRTFANTGAVGAIAFTAGSTAAVAGKPRGVAIGDLNGDGRGDVVASVEGTPHALAVLLGAGDGSVLPPAYQTLPYTPGSVRLADLDGDGRVDVVSLYQVGIITLRNLGAGPYPAPVAFGSPTTTEVSGNPYDARVADLDADGSPDVLVSATHSLNVLMNDGAGALAAPVVYAAGASVRATAAGLAVGDWNGDGRLDAAVVDMDNPYLYAYLGRGEGTFAAQQTVATSSPQRVLAADLDGDGDGDLITLDYAGGTATILRRGAGGAFTAGTLDLGGWNAGYPRDGKLADVNGDGVPDLLVVHLADQVSVALGQGAGTFAPRVAYPVSARPEDLAVGDLDGDLDLDIAVVSSTGRRLDLLLGRGDGTFTAGSSIVLPAAGYGVAVGDLDGDALADVVVALDTSGVRVYRGVGGGAFAPPVSYAGVSTRKILLADLTDDGRPDLVALHTSGTYGPGVSINLGDGTFGAETVYAAWVSTVAGPSGLAAADLDGDGSLDLAVTCGDSGVVSVLRNAGNGTLGTPTLWQVGWNPSSVAAADLDGDGRIDLAVANASANTVAVLRGECW